FYPTNVLVTGYDIIFFWVARMIFSGMEQMGQKPFSQVFIHGIVRDEQGRKMSKSLGNGIDPIEVIEQYGADSLRFMLMTGNSPGNDMRFQPERLEASRNFLNKLWNASRFALLNLSDYQPAAYGLQLTLADQWLLERLRVVTAAVNENMEKFELGEGLRQAYDFVWDEFCDWYVEIAKQRLYKGSPAEKHTAQWVLATALRQIMEMLHPFIPFITEEIWQQLPHQGETVMLAKYPDGSGMAAYPAQAEQMLLVMEIIRSIRNIRAEMNVPMGKKAAVWLFASPELLPLLQQGEGYILSLAAAAEIRFCASGTEVPSQAAKAHVRGVDIYLPLAGLIDLEKEIARLEKEIANCRNEMQRLAAKLSNQGFLAKAPADVVEKERQKQQETAAKMESLQNHLIILK
ncbi:MAG: class I tRNA ligase family protein, partial [Clostridiales bacterium]